MGQLGQRTCVYHRYGFERNECRRGVSASRPAGGFEQPKHGCDAVGAQAQGVGDLRSAQRLSEVSVELPHVRRDPSRWSESSQASVWEEVPRVGGIDECMECGELEPSQHTCDERFNRLNRGQ